MTGRDRTKHATSSGSQDVGQPAASDTTLTEGELMDRADEEARDIAPPPDASGSLADLERTEDDARSARRLINPCTVAAAQRAWRLP